MTSFLVRRHILAQAKKEKVRVQSIDAILKKQVAALGLNDNKIIFSWLLDFGRKTLNATAFFPGYIILNAQWAAHLVLYDSEMVNNAFRQTIGHELTHKENDYAFWEYFTKEKKFINWINEVHADFGSAEKTLDYSRDKLRQSLEYKRRAKRDKDKDSFTHPSWQTRCKYVEHYDFNEKLIKRVAKDTGCDNTGLIENVCRHYSEEMILHKEDL